MIPFKVRASSAGQLMTNGKAKGETFGKTAKSIIEDYLKEQIYRVKKSFTSKQTEKGTLLEDEAIDMAIDWANLEFQVKNEEFFENEFFTGTPDLILSDTIVDIKTSWDCFTFPLFEKSIPTDDYYYQLQVYMNLTGKRKAKLVYILLNTPDYLDGMGFDYSNVSPEKRCRVFDIEYDQETIDKLIERVKAARKYLQTLEQWHI